MPPTSVSGASGKGNSHNLLIDICFKFVYSRKVMFNYNHIILFLYQITLYRLGHYTESKLCIASKGYKLQKL